MEKADDCGISSYDSKDTTIDKMTGTPTGQDPVVEYDDVLEVVGQFGKYQRVMFFLACLFAIPAAFNNMGIVFLGGNQDHWCTVPELDSLNLSLTDVKLLTLPLEMKDGEERYSQCQMYACNWTQLVASLGTSDSPSVLASQAAQCGLRACDSGWTYDTSVYQSTIISEWDLVCELHAMTALSQSTYMAGLMVGVLVLGYFADVFGRWMALLVGLSLMLLFSLIVAFVPNFIAFVILRFCVAFGTIAVFTSGFVLVVELVGPKWRLFAGIVIEYFWAFGYLLVAVLAYLIRDWKNLQLALTIPIFLFLPMFLVLPESPRWLYTKGKKERGEKIMRKMADWNGVILPDVLNICIPNKTGNIKVYPWDLFRYPRLRIRTLIIYFNWFVCSAAYYGLSLNSSNLGGNDYVNFAISGAIEIPAYMFVQLTLDRVGRRPTLIASHLLGGVALLLSPAVLNQPGAGWVMIMLATIGKFGVSAAFAIIYIYSAELFPTVMRNVGVGSASFWARIGGIVAPQIALLGTYNKLVPLVVFGVISLVAGITVFFLPETVDRRLPETVLDAENFGRGPDRQESQASLNEL